MEKGQIIEITIDDISTEGSGIGRSEGMAVFVDGVVWQDTAQVEITKVKKNYAFARLVSVIEPSPYRIEAQCKYAGDCGGCAFQNMSYEGQIRLKEKQVRDKIMRLGKIENPSVNPIITMDQPCMYRNKAVMPISTGGIITRKGGIVENLGEPAVGFFKAKSHEIVDCQECMLQAPTVGAVASALRRFMKEDNITAWDPKWEKGLMRHVIVKTAVNTGEVMVILVINGKGIPNIQKLIMMLDDEIAELPPQENGVEYSLESVVLNVNKGRSNSILSDQCVTAAGRPTIREEMGGLEFEISPLAFYQVNPVQVEKLYGKVLEYANLQGGETVFDIYCGVGTIGLLCAAEMNRLCSMDEPENEAGRDDSAGAAAVKGPGRVIGIESVKGAVIDANRNAVINGIVNASYVHGKAEQEIGRLLEGYTDKDGFQVAPARPDIVILDPPRAGCDAALLQAVAGAQPDRIVYVSCDPATLARDIRLLAESGYEFVEATPVDMFPWTGHVETVVLMSKVR